jgi:hypothetical protein
MLNDFASVIESKNVYASPIAIAGPLLITVQDDEIAFGEDAFEMHALARIFVCHSREVFDESRFAVRDGGVMLNVSIACIFFDCFGGLTLIEHQIIKSHYIFFVLLKLLCHL